MMPRLAGGWQTTMADLALILFIVSVAGLQAHESGESETAEAQPSTQGEAVAIYRADEEAPLIGEWLDDQAPDPRQQLTILARYRPGEAEAASRQALALARQAGDRGRSARIVLEQGERADVLALLAFDQPADGVAQNLRN